MWFGCGWVSGVLCVMLVSLVGLIGLVVIMVFYLGYLVLLILMVMGLFRVLLWCILDSMVIVLCLNVICVLWL